MKTDETGSGNISVKWITRLTRSLRHVKNDHRLTEYVRLQYFIFLQWYISGFMQLVGIAVKITVQKNLEILLLDMPILQSTSQFSFSYDRYTSHITRHKAILVLCFDGI